MLVDERTRRSAAPASGTQSPLHPDPEIAASLEFDPVPRKLKRVGGWTPEAQRAFIAALAATGSIGRAADAIGMVEAGAKKLRTEEGAESFAAACERAMAIAEAERNGRLDDVMANLRKSSPDRGGGPGHPVEGSIGQRLNEFGEWEDEGSLRRRDEDARDNMARKLLNARRLYLHEISQSPGKRAAFEILTDHAVDWEKAQALEPQPDEPWVRPNMREPDMLLTAENGWLGDMARGCDKLAELRAAVDEHRAAEGLPAVDWSESTESSEQARNAR